MGRVTLHITQQTVVLYGHFYIKIQQGKKLAKTVAYIRASTDKQDIQHQQLQILDYANTRASKSMIGLRLGKKRAMHCTSHYQKNRN